MDKLRHAQEQENRSLNDTIDAWHRRHFHNVAEGTPMRAALDIARDDLKCDLGIAAPPDKLPIMRKTLNP